MDLGKSRAAARRLRAQRYRIQLSQARHDKRAWVLKRRERTHHLIELGGLVIKSGLVELMEDDRFALYGALLDIAAQIEGENGGAQIALWQRRGKRAFRMEAEALAELKQ